MRQRLKHSQGFQRDRPSQPADHLHTVSLLHAYYWKTLWFHSRYTSYYDKVYYYNDRYFPY